MGVIANQIVDQMTHLPEVVENPEIGVAILAAAGAVVLAQMRGHKNASDEYAAGHPNPALLKSSIKDVNTGEEVGQKFTKNRMARLGSSILMTVGLGLFVGAIVADPEISVTETSSDAQIAYVVDGSYSMIHTKDMHSGATRFETAKNGLEQADTSGKAAVVAFAAENKVVVPMSSDWQSQLDKLSSSVVDGNGGDVIAGLETAASLIPQSKNQQSTSKKNKETIVLITDGTVDPEFASSDKLAAAATKLSDENIQVKTIITGQENASYVLESNPAPIQSGIESAPFEVFGKGSVVVVHNSKSLEKALAQQANGSSSSTTQKEYWFPPLVLGAAIAAAGYLMDYFQKMKKVI